MIRAVLSLSLVLLPGFGLAGDRTMHDLAAVHPPGAGCTSPWLQSVSPPAPETEGAAVLRLALHSCIQDRYLPPKARLRRT